MRRRQGKNRGFTLIEISIVLVIIGLIVGGILVGQDLISAAATRATISQIEKYNTAVNTFKTKYNGIPGDILATDASTFGLPATPRAGTQAQGDGNGLLEGIDTAPEVTGVFQSGETVWFWMDLSAAHLIEGSFTSATSTPTTGGTYYSFTGSLAGYPLVSQLLPTAKIGANNYLYVYSNNGKNYYGLSTSTSWIDPNGALHNGIPALNVAQAYSIDKKIDDGLPQTGNVIAQYENWDQYQTYSNGIVWAAGGGAVGIAPGSPATASSTSCYDNGGGTGAMHYSMTQNNGALVNCALSFVMQGAAR